MMAPLVDWWGPAVVLNICGVIYTLVGVYAVVSLGVLRQQEGLVNAPVS
jgi:hypothetical protein